jgi:mannose-6-phosphate isomerase-like protein (cupin superfamily)
VIRLRAGCRTSLQYHERKSEVYFVLDGLARLHYRTDEGEITTAPFVCGTVATVQPLAWHRVEAITDVTLIEASTYDDGTDNVRVEDDYGRPNGYIKAEFGE